MPATSAAHRRTKRRTGSRKASARRPRGRSHHRAHGARKTRKWSRAVTEGSNALTLKKRVFASRSPKRIAASLKRSAERSRRRKSSPFRSAMSMLTFYVNRAGKNLPAGRRRILREAKQELRRQFGRS